MKKNCWEFHNCGRASGGEKTDKHGVCPAAEESKLHDIHGGTNAGRACWVIPATLCGDTVQGDFSDKMKDCFKCEFYNYVAKVEGKNHTPALELISYIK